MAKTKTLTTKEAQAMFAKASEPSVPRRILGTALVYSFTICFILIFLAGIKFAWTYLF